MVTLKNKDFITLHYYMTLLRNHVKKGFKKSYGKDERKEKLSLFDITKQTISERLEGVKEPDEKQTINFSQDQTDMIKAFIDFLIYADAQGQTEIIADIDRLKQIQRFFYAAG